MLKSASAGFTDIWRVQTIKDGRIYIMPPHDNHNPSLREMHALLQEMKTINDEGLRAQHDLDHLEFEWSSLNPLTHIKNYRDDKAAKADAWTGTTNKWALLSKQLKRDILKYAVEHDLRDAWKCLSKIISQKVYDETKEDKAKKVQIYQVIDQEDLNTTATIESIFTAFGKDTGLRAVIITKVRDTNLPEK